MDNTNNKQYWNEYVSYWENKVREANECETAKDKTMDDLMLETYFKKLRVLSSEKVLDYGCGSGRLYGVWKKHCHVGGREQYYGIDISGVCLEHAQKEYPDLEMGKNLKEFDGLHIPFGENTFEKVICFGVFDACSQELVIRELFRVLKPGGVLLLTGKNNHYLSDDKEALIAEINARKKGHPNYFTDVHSLYKSLLEHGVKIEEEYYFLKRGDFPRNLHILEMPDIFYEWALLLRKSEQYRDYEYPKFSEAFSTLGVDY